MNARIGIVFGLLFLLSGVLIFSQAGGGRPGGGRPGAPDGGSNPGPPVAAAEAVERYQSISAGGRLRPKIRIEHQPTVSGIVLEVFVRQAQYVSRGQDLFSIERDDAAGSFKAAVVTARISGIVSEISIQPRDEVDPGQRGVMIIGTGGFELQATISDKDAFKVAVGDDVIGNTVDGVELSGTLTGRSVEPDYSTGLFTLTFEFPNGETADVGEFVMVDLPVDRTTGIFLPRELLVRRYGQFFLWVVDEDNLLEIREVKTGKVIGDEVLITEGLSVGERYLTRLTGREKEGEPLEIPERQ